MKTNNAEIEGVEEIQLFPNPASDRFTINVMTGAIKYITINNIIGKEIKRMNARPTNSYEISDLKRGVYIIRIFDKKDELIKALRLGKT